MAIRVPRREAQAREREYQKRGIEPAGVETRAIASRIYGKVLGEEQLRRGVLPERLYGRGYGEVRADAGDPPASVVEAHEAATEARRAAQARIQALLPSPKSPRAVPPRGPGRGGAGLQPETQRKQRASASRMRRT